MHERGRGRCFSFWCWTGWKAGGGGGIDLQTSRSPDILGSGASPWWTSRSPDPQTSRSPDLLGSGANFLVDLQSLRSRSQTQISRYPDLRVPGSPDPRAPDPLIPGSPVSRPPNPQISGSPWLRSQSVGGSTYPNISIYPDFQISIFPDPHISRPRGLQIPGPPDLQIFLVAEPVSISQDLLRSGASPLVDLRTSRSSG